MNAKILLSVIILLVIFSIVPIEAISSESVQAVIGRPIIPANMYNVVNIIVSLNASDDERIVGAYSIDNHVIIVTSDRILEIYPDNETVVTANEQVEGRILSASYDGGEAVFLASYAGGKGYTIIYKYTFQDGLVKLAELPGYPWDIDARLGVVALVVHRIGSGFQVWKISLQGKWNASIPGDLIDVDLLSHINVTVSEKGSIVVYASGKGFEAIVAYDKSGSLVYKQVARNLFTAATLYSTAAWSPSGDRLALVYFNQTLGGYRLVELDGSTWKTLWARTVDAPINPEEGLVFNPTGCCLYYQYSPGSYLVVNTTTGGIVGVASWGPVKTRIYSWTSNGVWGVLARTGSLRGLSLLGLLGAPLVSFEYDPLYWSIDGRTVNPPPVNAGFLVDGRIWLVQEYGGKARIAIVDWPKYGIVYFDPGGFQDYFQGITVRDWDGGQWNGWLVPLIPAGGVNLTYTLHAKTKMWVKTILGTLGLIVGDPHVAEEVHWNATVSVRPLEFIHVRIGKEAASLVSHITLQIPPPCRLQSLKIEWATGSYTINDTDKHRITLVALKGAYNITATFNERDILYGPIQPTRLHLTAIGRENTTIQLLPQAIVLMIKGNQHAYLIAKGHEKYLPITENWTGYCIAPGHYKLVVQPSMIGAILAPRHWNITVNLTGTSKIVWIDTDKLIEGKLANLEIVNTATQIYTVEFYVKTGNGYQPIAGYNIPGGHTLDLKIIVGIDYKGVYYKKGSNTAEGVFEFTAYHSGDTVTIKIPSPATRTTTTTTSTPTGGVHHTQNPWIKTSGTTSPAGKQVTTARSRGQIGKTMLALGGVVFVAVLILIALKR